MPVADGPHPGRRERGYQADHDRRAPPKKPMAAVPYPKAGTPTNV